MKINVILFITYILFFGCRNDIQFDNDLTRENLKGKIKSIKEYTYKFTINTKNRTSSHVDIQESLESKTQRFYNAKGNIEKEISYNDDDSPGTTLIYEYDNDRLIKKTFFYNNEPVFIVNYKYDRNENVRLVEMQEGDRISRREFKYDEKGQVIQEISYNRVGAVDYDLHFKYDKKGNITEQIWLNEEGKQDLKWIFINNSRGKPIEQRVFNSKGERTVIAYFKYGKNGNLIEEYRNIKDFDEYVMKYEYVFDNQNNWTEKYSIRNGIKIFKFKREIIYL